MRIIKLTDTAEITMTEEQYKELPTVTIEGKDGADILCKKFTLGGFKQPIVVYCPIGNIRYEE